MKMVQREQAGERACCASLPRASFRNGGNLLERLKGLVLRGLVLRGLVLRQRSHFSRACRAHPCRQRGRCRAGCHAST